MIAFFPDRERVYVKGKDAPCRTLIYCKNGGGENDYVTVIREDNGELVAAVCCTSARGAKVTMWGGGSLAAAKLRVVDFDPVTIPLRPVQPALVRPTLIPIRFALPQLDRLIHTEPEKFSADCARRS